MIKPTAILSLIVLLALSSFTPYSAPNKKDPHYTGAGFFDIHVCNWPDRPPFIMGVFSTVNFTKIKSIEIFTPNSQSLGFLDLNKFRTFKNKKKQLKKAFIKQFKVPEVKSDGWYKAVITLTNNQKIIAKDLVHHKHMPYPLESQPANNSSDIKLPKRLSWEQVKDAKYYQVFISDLWQDGKIIYTSKLLKTNHLTVPKGILQNGGLYSWRIHARDINEDVQLGDFNHGSLSVKFTFSVEEE